MAYSSPTLQTRGIQSLGIHSPVVGEVFPADPPAWSLFFELFASFIFVALLKMEKRILIRTIITSYVILALGGAQWAFVEYHYDPDLGLGWGTSNFLLGFPRVLFGFTFGVFLYRFANEGNWIGVRNTFRRYNISPWLLYFSLTAVLLVPITLGGLYSALVLAIVAPMLVFFGAAIDCNNVFDAAASRFFGWLSYPIYCLHYPIGRLVFLLTDGSHYSPVQVASISIALTVAVSIVATKLYEEPTRAYLTLKLRGALKSNAAELNPEISAKNDVA